MRSTDQHVTHDLSARHSDARFSIRVLIALTLIVAVFAAIAGPVVRRLELPRN